MRARREVVTASLSRRGFLKTGAAGLLLATGLRPGGGLASLLALATAVQPRRRLRRSRA